MKYTLTVEFETDAGLGDAIDSARHMLPVSLHPDSLNAVQDRGLRSYHLQGEDGREVKLIVEAPEKPKPPKLPIQHPVAYPVGTYPPGVRITS